MLNFHFLLCALTGIGIVWRAEFFEFIDVSKDITLNSKIHIEAHLEYDKEDGNIVKDLAKNQRNGKMKGDLTGSFRSRNIMEEEESNYLKWTKFGSGWIN